MIRHEGPGCARLRALTLCAVGGIDLPQLTRARNASASAVEISALSHVRQHKRVLKDAELPLHFTPHCLRHTFASLLLQQGESPAYVQRQLGHASIQLTVDTYGRWLPMGNKAAVDRLDDAVPGASGSKVVANSVFGGTGASEPAELSGAGGGS